VKSGPGEITGVILTAGSDTATLILYDNTAGSGTVILNLSAVANTSVTLDLSHPAAFGKGCYAVTTGAAENASVFYL